MVKLVIPESVKQEVDALIEKFNKRHRCVYIPRYKKDCLYLDRDDEVAISHICRLTYTGKMNDWEFAIFKYSDEQYDDEEFFFPGSGRVDGTIEGAMLAGLEAYPF